MQTHLGFIHEEHPRLPILHQGGEQEDEHLFLARRENVGRKRFVVLQEAEFVARSVEALARFAEEVVEQILELRFRRCGLGGFGARTFAAEVRRAIMRLPTFT